MRHMPSHINILRGDYHAALVANERAIEADRKYLEREGPFNFYTLFAMSRLSLQAYAAMFLGHYRPAWKPPTKCLRPSRKRCCGRRRRRWPTGPHPQLIYPAKPGLDRRSTDVTP